MYKKGDYAIYRHDICTIKDIRKNKLSGITYHVMNPIDDDSLIINIPIKDRMSILKDVISSDDAKKLIERIPNIDPIEDINEKNLEIKYKKLLNSGKYDDPIKIIKTTFLRNESRTNN